MTKTSHTLFPIDPRLTRSAGRELVQLTENYATLSTTRVKREYGVGHQFEVIDRGLRDRARMLLCRDSTGCRVYLPAGIVEPVVRDDDAPPQPAGGNDGDDTGGGPVGELAAATQENQHAG